MGKQPKGRKRVPDGIIHIHASANNTIMVVTDMDGKVVDWVSGGRIGLKGSASSTSFAAQRMVKWVMQRVRTLRWNLVKIWVTGFGQGRFVGIRSLCTPKRAKFTVLLVKDVTPMPYGGCRLKKRRRL